MKFIKTRKISEYETVAIYIHNDVKFAFNLLAFANSGYEREKINEGLKEIESIFFDNSCECWSNLMYKKDVIKSIMDLEQNNYITFYSIGSIFQTRKQIKKAIEKEFFSF